MSSELHDDRGRLLASARALGLPVSDALDRASVQEVRDQVRCLAEDALRETDARLARLQRQRATLAALLTTPPDHV